MKPVEFTLQELDQGAKKEREGWSIEAKIVLNDGQNAGNFPYKIMVEITILGKKPKKPIPITITLEEEPPYEGEIKEGGIGHFYGGKKPEKIQITIG